MHVPLDLDPLEFKKCGAEHYSIANSADPSLRQCYVSSLFSQTRCISQKKKLRNYATALVVVTLSPLPYALFVVTFLLTSGIKKAGGSSIRRLYTCLQSRNGWGRVSTLEGSTFDVAVGDVQSRTLLALFRLAQLRSLLPVGTRPPILKSGSWLRKRPMPIPVPHLPLESSPVL